MEALALLKLVRTLATIVATGAFVTALFMLAILPAETLSGALKLFPLLVGPPLFIAVSSVIVARQAHKEIKKATITGNDAGAPAGAATGTGSDTDFVA